MKTTKLNIRAILMVLVIGLSTASLNAQKHKCYGTCMDSVPGITAEQKTQIDALREKHQAEMKPLHEQIKALHDELLVLEKAEPRNQETIDAKINEIGMLKITLMQKRSANRYEVFSVLTKEQQAFLIDCRENRKGKFKHGMGPGYHGVDMRNGKGNRPYMY